MLIILFTFALVHSGLASLRGVGEKLIGERAFRVLFAASSLPLAVSAVVSILFTCPSLPQSIDKRISHKNIVKSYMGL